MAKNKKDALPDTQALKDYRGVRINRVGVVNLKFPLDIVRQDKTTYKAEADFELFGSLFHRIRGTNMSRFISVLMEKIGASISPDNFYELLLSLKKSLKCEDVYISAQFNFPIIKKAPATGKESILYYNCKFIGKMKRRKYDFILQVQVPVTTVCPCSKAISKYGAHGQKGYITVQLKGSKVPWIEELVPIIEQCGSCEIYSLLKRPDEKFVTEKAHNNPKFGEDVARDVAVALQKMKNIDWFRIKVVNQESIHDHLVAVYVEKRRKRGRKKWETSEKKFV